MSQKTNKIILVIGLLLVIGLALYNILVFQKSRYSQRQKESPKITEIIKYYSEIFDRKCSNIYLSGFNGKDVFICSYDIDSLGKKQNLQTPKIVVGNRFYKKGMNLVLLNIGEISKTTKLFQENVPYCVQLTPALQSIYAFPPAIISLKSSKEQHPGILKADTKDDSNLVCVSRYIPGEPFWLRIIGYLPPDTNETKFNIKILQFPSKDKTIPVLSTLNITNIYRQYISKAMNLYEKNLVIK